MLSEIQNKQIKTYKKLAKKNKGCKYIATVLIVITIFWGDVLRHNKRRIILVSQLMVLTVLFLFNASFAPPAFSKEIKENETVAEEDNDATLPVTENAAMDKSLNKNEQVSLDDLMENKDASIIEPVLEEQTVFEKDDWKLLLVNKQHPIPEDYSFTLGTIKGSMKCDERIIAPLTEMFEAAKKDGINLVVCSPYRDINRQEFLFNRKMNQYLNNGYSYLESYKNASITVTVPGASEHEIGLALDIISDNYSALDEGFGETQAGLWLKENSKEYGFILRYPKGKEDITGIQYEPWHFRYVGKMAACVIMEQDITLEEFIDSL